MTTENGLPKMSRYRRAVETLTRRREYLEERIVVTRGAGVADGAVTYMEAEAAALALAIPLLEVEWDNMARLRRQMMTTEGRDPTPVDAVTPPE